MIDWEIVLKVLIPIVSAGVAYSQRRFFVRPRARLKADLELLELLKGDEVQIEREKIRSRIVGHVDEIYGSGTTPAKPNWIFVVFGAIWAIGFSYFTYSIYQEWSNWGWSVLTGYLAVAGVVWIILGLQGHGTASPAQIPSAKGVTVTEDTLTVKLSDGRIISAPLDWYSKLLDASPDERNNCKFIGEGHAIRWETIGQEIKVESLLAVKSPRLREPLRLRGR